MQTLFMIMILGKFGISGEWYITYTSHFDGDSIAMKIHGIAVANLNDGILGKKIGVIDSSYSSSEAIVVDINKDTLFFLNLTDTICEKKPFNAHSFKTMVGQTYEIFGTLGDIDLSDPVDSAEINGVKLYTHHFKTFVVKSDTDTIYYQRTVKVKRVSVKPEFIPLQNTTINPLWISDYPIGNEGVMMCEYGSIRRKLVWEGLAPVFMDITGFDKNGTKIFHFTMKQKYLDPEEGVAKIRQAMSEIGCN